TTAPTLFPYTTLFRSSKFSPKCSRDTASARNSPRESHLKWPSCKNCCICLGADPPAPVSNNPPPFIRGTMDNIFALVPNSRIGRSEEHTSELQSRENL